MRKGRSLFLAALGALGAAWLGSGLGWAQGKEAQGPGMLGRRPFLDALLLNIGRFAQLKRELGLGEEQRARLKEVFKSHKPEIVRAIHKVRAARRKLLALVRADSPNEAAIRAAAPELTGPLTEAAILRSRLRGEALAVLTPGQRGQVERFQAGVQKSVDEALDEWSAR